MSAVYQTGMRDLRPGDCAVATAIKSGWMLWRDTDGTLKPASGFTWDTNLATTQAAFASKFAGIAASNHAANDADTDVLIDVSPFSAYQMGCSVATFVLGDMIAPAQDGANNALSNTLVAKTSTTANAIGRVHQTRTVATASIWCYFASAFRLGSGNKSAEVGA